MKQKITFSFGKNWYKYVKQEYNEARYKEAEKSIKQFFKTKTFKGKTFIDVGCGTGIFSLVAYRMGAKEIISFDIDPYSVKSTQYMKEKYGNNANNWKVFQGNILDKSLIKRIKKGDIVYSWGVLHHTGEIWKAIENTISLVKPKGLMYIAIYNDKRGIFGSDFWLMIKKFYNNNNRLIKTLMENFFILGYYTVNILQLKNPWQRIKNYKERRGMDWRRDVDDWLGGYPYEYATKDEVREFCEDIFEMELINMKDCSGTLLNNHFLFRR